MTNDNSYYMSYHSFCVTLRVFNLHHNTRDTFVMSDRFTARSTAVINSLLATDGIARSRGSDAFRRRSAPSDRRGRKSEVPPPPPPNVIDWPTTALSVAVWLWKDGYCVKSFVSCRAWNWTPWSASRDRGPWDDDEPTVFIKQQRQTRPRSADVAATAARHVDTTN